MSLTENHFVSADSKFEIARSTSSVDLDSALFRESEDAFEISLEESSDAERKFE